MDSILGTWMAFPKDVDNLPGYIQAMGKAHISANFEKGLEMVITKEGNGDFLVCRYVGGFSLAKEVLRADGKVEMKGTEIPAGVINLTHKWEAGHLIVEGNIKEVPTRSKLQVSGSTMKAEVTIRGIKVNITYTKKA